MGEGEIHMQLVGRPEGKRLIIIIAIAGVANSSLLLVKLPTGLYRQKACYENVLSTEIYYLAVHTWHMYVGWQYKMNEWTICNYYGHPIVISTPCTYICCGLHSIFINCCVIHVDEVCIIYLVIQIIVLLEFIQPLKQPSSSPPPHPPSLSPSLSLCLPPSLPLLPLP